MLRGMTVLMLFLPLSALVLAIGCAAFLTGIRDGDRPGDASVEVMGPGDGEHGICFSVDNPSPQPVLIGASLRRRGLRLRAEGGRFVSMPRRTMQGQLLAGEHTTVYVIPAGETHMMTLASSRPVPRAAELVVAIGEPDRLRVEHRAVGVRRPPRDARRLSVERARWLRSRG